LTRSQLEEEITEVIRPTQEERSYINTMAKKILAAVKECTGDEVTAMVVGSVARDTFVRGDRDLDIFILYDPSLTHEELEERGLTLARGIAQSFGGAYREKFAEHPYINATIDSIDVDLVPCYAVERASEIKSAVDRTPFHTRYISERIRGLVDDVLLLKQFTKAGGVYGSDHTTGGFSGYLCELLTLHYGGFAPLLAAASKWRPGVVIDIEQHGKKVFEDPLTVIDPVDPERNVASALTLDRMSEFIELSWGYLKKPQRAFFFPPPRPRLSREEFRKRLAHRGTALYAITFSTPPYTEDTVMPQLRKSLDSILNLLRQHGFVINRADCQMETKQSMLLIEMLVDSLPAVRRHMGPPVWSIKNAEKFQGKYIGRADTVGPFIEDGRYVVEVSRRYPLAYDLLTSPALLGVGLGKHVKQSMTVQWDVFAGEECWNEHFAQFISDFLQASSPLTHILRGPGD